jgi:CheY-like chemotaxis protein
VTSIEISSTGFAPPPGFSLRWLVPDEPVKPGSVGLETGPKAERDDATGPTRKVVLVVDDEQGMLDLMRFVLEGEGFEVETARNGVEALQRLRTGMRPALVLLDMMMPVMSGWELLDEVARLPSLELPPIVVLTAAGSAAVPGAAAVLRKPYELETLLETVDRYTGGGK